MKLLLVYFLFSPKLTWRDIQHLIVLTTTKSGFSDTYSSWQTNGAGKECMYSFVSAFLRKKKQLILFSDMQMNLKIENYVDKGSSVFYYL